MGRIRSKYPKFHLQIFIIIHGQRCLPLQFVLLDHYLTIYPSNLLTHQLTIWRIQPSPKIHTASVSGPTASASILQDSNSQQYTVNSYESKQMRQYQTADKACSLLKRSKGEDSINEDGISTWKFREGFRRDWLKGYPSIALLSMIGVDAEGVCFRLFDGGGWVSNICVGRDQCWSSFWWGFIRLYRRLVGYLSVFMIILLSFAYIFEFDL